jgi:predicted nucleic acid-binding protein
MADAAGRCRHKSPELSRFDRASRNSIGPFRQNIRAGIVRNELQHDEAPESVGRWIATPPSWLEIVPEKHESDDPDLLRLDDGERAAILLAIRIGAELLLIDERNGVDAARSRGFAVTGTLGILDLAASRGLIQLHETIERLKKTSFRYPPAVLDALLARHSPEGKP